MLSTAIQIHAQSRHFQLLQTRPDS